MSGPVLFCVSNLSLALAAGWVGGLVTRGHSHSRRLLASVVLFPALVVVILLALGMAGLLTCGWAAGAAVAVALVAGLLRWRAGAPPADPETPGLPADEQRAFRVALGALAAVAALYVGYAALLGGTFAPDDLSYHAVLPADWLVHHRLTLGIGNYQAYYPSSAELLAAWFMLPFGDDRYTSLTTVVWAALAVVALLSLARSLGASHTGAVVVALLFLVAAPVLRRLNTFSAVDLAGPAATFAACALLAPVRMGRGLKPSAPGLGDMAVSGLALGLAIGSKGSFLPLTLVMYAWLCFRLRGACSWGQGLGRLAVHGCTAFATGGYWYARNAILTGNPLFPFQVGPLAGPFTSAEQARTKLASCLPSPEGLSVLWGYVTDWPAALFLLALLGYGFGMAAVSRRRGADDGGTCGLPLLVVASGLALAALFPFAPFSGTTEWAGAPLVATCRYVLASFGLGLALLALALAPGPALRNRLTALLALAALALAETLLREGRLAAAAIVGSLVCVGLPVGLAAGDGRRGAALARRLALPGLVAGLALLAVWAPHKAARTDVAFSRSVTRADKSPDPPPMGGFLAALDELPRGSRIGWFSARPAFCYWAYGRRLQFVPMPLTPDGLPLEPLHLRCHTAEPTDWWTLAGSLQGPARDLSSLATNLRASGVDYVVVTRWMGDGWPEQQAAIARQGASEEIYNDGVSAVWAVR